MAPTTWLFKITSPKDGMFRSGRAFGARALLKFFSAIARLLRVSGSARQGVFLSASMVRGGTVRQARIQPRRRSGLPGRSSTSTLTSARRCGLRSSTGFLRKRSGNCIIRRSLNDKDGASVGRKSTARSMRLLISTKARAECNG